MRALLRWKHDATGYTYGAVNLVGVLLIILASILAASVIATNITNTRQETPMINTLSIENIEENNGWITIIVKNTGTSPIPGGNWSIYIMKPHTHILLYHVDVYVEKDFKPRDTRVFRLHESDLIGTGIKGRENVLFLLKAVNGASDSYRKEIEIDPSINHMISVLNFKRVLVDEDRDGIVDHTYNEIQNAIDNSPTNSLIIAGPGIYTENVSIDKPVTLLGLGKKKTIIMGSLTIGNLHGNFDTVINNLKIIGLYKPAVKINNQITGYKGRVILENLYIKLKLALNGDQAILAKNRGTKPISMKKIFIDAKNIQSNRINSKILLALTPINMTNTMITSNPNIRVIGLDISSATGNIIKNNTFRGTCCGLYVFDSRRSIIEYNVFENNPGYWIRLDAAKDVSIHSNSFTDKGWMDIADSSNVSIVGNRFNNRSSGFIPTLRIIISRNIYVLNNSFVNLKNGISLSHGFSNKHIIVSNNTFRNISWYALSIYIEDATSDIVVDGNDMRSVSEDASHTFIDVSIESIRYLNTVYINHNILNDTLGNRIFITLHDSRGLTNSTCMLNATFNTFVYNETVENIKDKILDICDGDTPPYRYGYINATPVYYTTDEC